MLGEIDPTYEKTNEFYNPLIPLFYIPMHNEQGKGYNLHDNDLILFFICFNLDLVMHFRFHVCFLFLRIKHTLSHNFVFSILYFTHGILSNSCILEILRIKEAIKNRVSKLCLAIRLSGSNPCVELLNVYY